MKKMLIAALVAAAAFGAAPARAANVTVTLDIRAGRIGSTPVITCPVVVPALSNGGTVLARAVATGCILEYTLAPYGGLGHKVVSIDHVREVPDEAMNAAYWAMTRNGSYTAYGIDLYQAAAGDRLGFTYTTWLGYLACDTPAGCIE